MVSLGTGIGYAGLIITLIGLLWRGLQFQRSNRNRWPTILVIAGISTAFAGYWLTPTGCANFERIFGLIIR